MQAMAKESITTPAFKPALVYGMAGKHDQGYNYSAYVGAEKFKKEFGIDYVDADCVSNDAQREQIIRTLARRGHNPIVAIAYEWAAPIEKVAKEYPKTKFSISHSIVNLPNVQSVYWDAHHFNFLGGIVAGIKTKNNKLGTIIGADAPIIQADVCGFRQGAKYINKDIIFINNIVDPHLGGWNNPARGAEIANSQIDRGVDIIYSVTGNTDYGVIKSITDAKVMGVFSAYNRNSLSKYVLLSIVGDAGVVVYNTFKDVMKDNWKPGVLHIGLTDKAQYLAIDEFNRQLISTEIEQAVDKAKKAIIAGKLKVVDYRTNNYCPL